MRPIDADEILDIINNENYPDYQTYSDIFDVIDSAPTIEAQPVRHGEWLDSGINGTMSCSLCMFTDFFAKQNRVMLFKYCPQCGARMDEKEND